jgi:hypothetical protein
MERESRQEEGGGGGGHRHGWKITRPLPHPRTRSSFVEASITSAQCRSALRQGSERAEAPLGRPPQPRARLDWLRGTAKRLGNQVGDPARRVGGSFSGDVSMPSRTRK